MFGDSWGPRLEYILRYTILALLDRPETTMLDITRMLTDKKFRKETLSYCTDTVVLQFWNVEFASWTDKFQAEAIAPVLNKVGAFTANPVIRNIIGQPKSTFNIRQIMDEGKILVVNLSKGLIGEDNAGILGSFLVTKIQLAAMSRSDIPDIKDRRPFYLYVDEFQNFATDSFATILSEARKYGLNLTVANQYISQMQDTVRDAVFGNVGTMISFRVSADDSPILAKQFEPQFEPNDLLQMHNRNFIVNMVINGEKAPAFSAKTLNLPPAQDDNTGRIIQWTRENYSRSREEIEKDISERILPPENLIVKRPGPAYTPPKSEEQREADRKAREAEMLAQGKTWPISNVTPDEVNTALQTAKERGSRTSEIKEVKQGVNAQPDTPMGSGNTDDDKPKKKRSRTRKRKTTNSDAPSEPNRPRIVRADEQGSTTPTSRPTSPADDPTILSLR
jgi:hypothetical protein